jgi:hypothetical protein
LWAIGEHQRPKPVSLDDQAREHDRQMEFIEYLTAEEQRQLLDIPVAGHL